MFKRKIVSLMLAATMLISVTGCGSDKSQTASSNDGDVVTIQYWHVNSEKFGGPTVTKLINEFNEMQDDIVVEEKFVPNYYVGIMEEMQTAAASNSIPDVVQIGWPYLEYFSNNFSYCTPEELIEKYCDNKNYLSDTYEDAIADLTINIAGDRVGFPYGLSFPTLFVNTKMLSQAGLTMDDVQNWEDIRKAAVTLQESTGKYGIYVAEWNSIWEVQEMIEGNGGKIVENGECTINSPEAIDAYSFYADMVLEDKTALRASYDEGRQAFLNGEVALYFAPCSDNSMVESALGDDVDVVPAPVFEGNETAAPVGGNFLAVTAQDEEKQEATFKFIQFLLESDSMVTWTDSVGYIPHVKGVDSSQMSDNIIKITEVMDSAVPWYCFPGDEGLNAEQILIAYRDKILSGEKSSEEALKEIQDQINALYK